MNLDWLKFALYCIGLGLAVFWMVVIFLSMTGCAGQLEQGTDTDVLYCVGGCIFVDSQTTTTADGEAEEIEDE